MATVTEIGRLSVSAVKWSALGTAARYGLQLAAQIILARLLGPENYGLFAMGFLVLTLSNLVADFGFSVALIQSRELSNEDVRFVFTWQVICGILAMSSLYMLAPALANYFNEPLVESIVRWLGLACLMNALAEPATKLLKRNLNFRALQIIQISSYSIGYFVVGIPLAYYGAGVWALVVAWIANASCMLVLAVIRQPHPIKPLIWHKNAGSFFRTGVTVFAANVCNWILNNVDRIFVGRFLNAQSLGLYVVGYSVAANANSLLVTTLQPAFFAAGARIQTEHERLRRAYLSVLATTWILVAPASVLFALLAQDLVIVLYGPAWAPAGTVLAILALCLPAYVTWGMSSPILWNTGRRHYEILLQVPLIVVAGFAFYNFARDGIFVVALVAAGVAFARAILTTAAACRQLAIAPRDLLPFGARGVTMVLLAAAGVIAGSQLGNMPGATKMHALLGGLFAGSAVVLSASLICPWLVGETVIEMLRRFIPSPPADAGGDLRRES